MIPAAQCGPSAQTPSPLPIQPSPKTSRFSHFLLWIDDTLADAGSKSLIYAGVGYLLSVRKNIYAVHFYTIGLGLFTATLGMQIALQSNLQGMQCLKEKASSLVSRYPYIQLIATVFAAVITPTSPSLGIASAVCVGILSALTLDIGLYKHLHFLKSQRANSL